MLLVLFHHPNGKNSRPLVACHCTVMSLVVGNELPNNLPDMTLHAHDTEWLGRDLLGFFGSQLVGAGGDLSSCPLGGPASVLCWLLSQGTDPVRFLRCKLLLGS